jgi:hypothetical protein
MVLPCYFSFVTSLHQSCWLILGSANEQAHKETGAAQEALGREFITHVLVPNARELQGISYNLSTDKNKQLASKNITQSQMCKSE